MKPEVTVIAYTYPNGDKTDKHNPPCIFFMDNGWIISTTNWILVLEGKLRYVCKDSYFLDEQGWYLRISLQDNNISLTGPSQWVIPIPVYQQERLKEWLKKWSAN